MNSYLTDIDSFIKVRGPLWHTRRAIERGKITIGFLGGSITENIEKPWDGRRWSDKVVNWFVGAFPGLIVNVENAAKGATGSLSAIFRVEEDIIAHDCDLVFIEYAVNDGEPANHRADCREGLIRKLLSNPKANCDLCVTYTFNAPMYEAMARGEQPASIAEFEPLCEHYRISSVFMGAYALREVNAGRLRWSEWLPDGLHPGDMGSNVYAAPVTKLLADEMTRAEETHEPLPAPLSPTNWQRAHQLPLDEIERHGAWRLFRERRMPTVDRILYTSALNASLSFRFAGTGLVIATRFSSYSSDYRLRVDGGEWIVRAEEPAEWMKRAFDYIRSEHVVWDLPDGEHFAELETIRGGRGQALGSDFELCTVGVVCS